MVRAIEATLWSFRQLKYKEVLILVIVPCVVHMVLLLVGAYFLFDWLSSLFQGFFQPSASTLGWRSNVAWLAESVLWFIAVVLCVGFVATGFSVLTIVAHTIASPFNGWLSSTAESRLRPLQHPTMKFRTIVVNGFHREWLRLKYWLLRVIILIPVSLLGFWIPVINVVIGLLWIALSAWMLGLQAVDYAADNNGISFERTLKACQAERVTIFLLGLIMLGLMLVPVLNLLSMALSVIAGTYTWVRMGER